MKRPTPRRKITAALLHPRRVGFSLVELLVVITIIAILAAMLLPAAQSARETARQMQCRNKIRQIALAIRSYDNTHEIFPYGISYDNPIDGVPPTPELSGKGWILTILPQLEQQKLFDQFIPGFDGSMVAGGGIAKPECVEAVKTQLPILQCPSEPSVKDNTIMQFQWANREVAQTSYKGVIGDTRMGGGASAFVGNGWDCHRRTDCPGIFWRNSYLNPTRLSSIRDGLASTFMVGEDVAEENHHSAAYYCNGDYASCHVPLNYFPGTPREWWNVMSFRSLHPGGAHFCMADGSVHFIHETINYDLYRALSTKAGGEVVDVP